MASVHHPTQAPCTELVPAIFRAGPWGARPLQKLQLELGSQVLCPRVSAGPGPGRGQQGGPAPFAGVSVGRQCAVPPGRPSLWLFPTAPMWHLRGIRRVSVWGVLCPCESSPRNPRAASPWEGPALTVGSHLHGGRVGRAAPERSRLLCPRVSLGPRPLGSPAGSGQGAEGVSVQGCRGGVGGGCSGFSFGHLLPTSRGQCPVLGGRVCSGLGPTLSGLLVTCRILTLMHRWP